MNSQEFDVVLNRRIELIRQTLQTKGAEYVRNGNRLHNFEVGAAFMGSSQEMALLGFLVKHLVSIRDLVIDTATGGKDAKPEVWDEKIGDAICYLILLEAVRANRASALRSEPKEAER